MSNTTRTQNTFRNSFWGMASKILGMICPFFFRAIIIRRLGAEYIGLSGLFKSILSVLNMTELGFGSAIIYMMYKPIAENDLPQVRSLLNAIRKIYKYVGLAILVIGCAVFPFLNVLVKNDTGADVNLYVLYGMYLFNAVVSYLSYAYCSTLFIAYQRNDITSKIVLITEIFRYSLQLLVLYLTKNYYIYLAVFALSVIPQNILYYVVAKKKFPDIYCEGSITQEQKNSIKQKVLPLLVHRIGGTVIVSIDDMIISAFLGITALTQYDNYYYIFFSVTTFLTVFRTSVIASLGNKIYSSTVNELYGTYKKVFFVWVIIVGWCACFMIGLYQQFIQMWVGAQYVYSNQLMILICVYFFVWQFRFIGVTMKEAAGLWEPDRWKPIVGMVLNFVFSVLLVKITGSVSGVLIPTIFVMAFIYYPWETHVLFKHVFKRSSGEYVRFTLKCCLSVAAAAAAVFFISQALPAQGFGSFLIKTAVCVIVPGLVFFAFHFQSRELQSALSDVRRIANRFLKRVR